MDEIAEKALDWPAAAGSPELRSRVSDAFGNLHFNEALRLHRVQHVADVSVLLLVMMRL